MCSISSPLDHQICQIFVLIPSSSWQPPHQQQVAPSSDKANAASWVMLNSSAASMLFLPQRQSITFRKGSASTTIGPGILSLLPNLSLISLESCCNTIKSTIDYKKYQMITMDLYIVWIYTAWVWMTQCNRSCTFKT